MSIRARTLFLVSLALVVGQLALPGPASTASAGEAAAPVVEPVQAHHAPHPASSGARSWLPDRPADRLVDPRPDDPAAARSRAPNHPLPPVHVRAAEPSRFGSSADAVLLLPPARAPPALS